MKHLYKNMLLTALAIGSTTAYAKKHSTHKSSPLPLVDVHTPLHVEKDQFGRPIVIGTPEEGPEHGPGSYFYQVGYLSSRENMKINFANYIAQQLEITGRFAEYVPGYIGQDIAVRKQTYTLEQVKIQIEDGINDGTIPLEVIDWIDGLSQGVLDHIVAIENNEEPLPAEFVEGVGLLSNWWAERNDPLRGAASLVNRATFAQWVLVVDLALGTGISVNVQTTVNLNGLVSANAISGGNPQTQDIFNDVYGFLGVNSRFTVAEGDRAGVYCPTTKRHRQPTAHREASCRLYESSSQELDSAEAERFIQQMKTSFEEREYMHMMSPDPQTKASDFLVVGSALTKNKGTLMSGNSQISWGLNRIFSFRAPFSSFITPRATYVDTGESGTFTRSSGSYGVHYSFASTDVFAADGIWELPTNLILISDDNTPGGTAHSTLFERLENGTVQEVTISIYQGNERKSLENNVAFGPSIYMVRRPQTWMRDGAIALRGIASQIGILPFNTIEEFAQNAQNSFLQMVAGLDTEGNIFTYEQGVYQDPDPSAHINRLLPGDATGGIISSFAGRALPFVEDSNYFIRPGGLVVNPPCGFITGWNNIWANDRQTRGRRFAMQRVNNIFSLLSQKLTKKGKLEFDDMVDLWSSLTYTRGGADVNSSALNYDANPWPVIGKRLIKALKRKGKAVGLTKKEIKRTISLLKDYDGRSIPATSQPDILSGRNFDGRWVLSSIWLSFIALSLFERAFPDDALREAAFSLAFVDLTNVVPGNDWTINEPTSSRVQPVGVGATATPANTFISVLNLGADLGNGTFYPWLEVAGLTSEEALDEFYAEALVRALTNQTTGANLDTGLTNPKTGRANLCLIQDDGTPLHPGWGQFQRPTTLPNQVELRTQFLIEPFNVLGAYSTLNAEGDRKYVERDCKGRLIHNQLLTMLGAGALLTVNEEGQVDVDPQDTAMDLYFRGNYQTDEISVDKKPVCKKR